MIRPCYFGAAMLAAILHTAPACPQQRARTVVPVSATGPLAGEKVYGRSYALLIGVNQYVNSPAINLHYAVKDVTALRDILVRSYGFPAENITVLTDAQATRDKILAALDDLCDTKRIGENDRILIYFSGHGQSIKQGVGADVGFLIPYDAAKIDLEGSEKIQPYRDTCVPVGGVRETLDRSPARHILLLADCCFSGLLAEDKGRRALPQLSPDTLAVMSRKRTRQIMTAGGAGELSHESDVWGHGAFTYKLLEDLEAQSALEVTAFTARSLHSVLQSEVMDLTNQQQNPKFADRGAGGEFLFITTARNAPPQIHALPPSLPADTTIKALEQELRSYQDGLKGGSSLPFLRKYAPGRYSEWFEECQKGNAIAEFFVARCFEEGIAVPTDNAKSLKWATRSADHGNIFAMNLLGYVNEYGVGVPRDHATALQWYQKAADQGNGLAMLNLGKAYADADSPEHDYAKAMEAYLKSVEAGYAEAMRMIGNLYAYGSGVTKDPVVAKKWYRQAADAGDTYSAGLLLADRIGPAFKSYAAAEAAPPDKAAALQAVRNALPDFNGMDIAATAAVLSNENIAGVTAKMRAGDKDDTGDKTDAAKKTPEGGATDPLLTLHDQMLERYIRLYEQSSQDTKVQYINSFASATTDLLKKRYENGQYNDVLDFWKKSYEGMTISSFTQGEKDGVIRELNTCVNGLLKGGNRKEGKQLLEDALALCDGVLKDRPWDWYAKDAYGGLCLAAAATLWELGDNDAVQPLLKRGWGVLLREFGREDMLKRYATLPLKGQLPEGASAADAAFFKGFRTDEQKKADKTEKPGITDKAEGAGKLRKFTVPVEFAGTKCPFDIYVFSGPNGYTELQDQFRWVKDYRGGVVPPEVLSSFLRLNKMAVDNKVDFCDLCIYVFDTDSADTPTEAAKPTAKKTKVRQTRDFDFSIEESLLKELEAKKSIPQKP